MQLCDTQAARGAQYGRGTLNGGSRRVLAGALLLCVVWCGLVQGKTADEYMHGGAQHYIHGRPKQAKMIVAEGLARYPDDPRLAALAGLIKDEEQQQQQNQQDQQNEQDQQDQQDQQNQQDQQQKQQDEQQNKQDKQDGQQKNQDQKQNEQDPSDQDDKQNQPPQPRPQKNDEEKMKKEEAARLLRQFADDDKNLNKPEKKAIAPGARPEKDW
ncbi:MAG: hypothetical protein GF331_27190 [Chitinivibrionales bacterium]|nr:hypothetical protein [Chitinivibrionales bacterium]